MAIIITLTGCTSDSNMAFQTLRDSMDTAPDVSISAKQIAQLPYASSYMQIGGSARALVVLGKVNGDDRLWFSQQKEIVVTRFGRVIRTDGLNPINIEGVRFTHGDPLAKGLNGLEEHHYQAQGFVSSMPGYHFDLPFSAHYQVKGKVDVSIADKKVSLVQVNEDYSIPLLDFHTVNHYWLDASNGLVYKSQQQLLPSIPPFTITLLKPYQQDLQ
ncbi:YjbF family lipoprotein [Marinomonas sp. TI.3.20]|uniref:YjbF family lipoprotein n=1 Tax=Marinomonas sp. TI.3.20 TaxID=3121296 RepID=UPI00311EDB1F